VPLAVLLIVLNCGATRYSVLTAQGHLPSLAVTASVVDMLRIDWTLLTEWSLSHYGLRSAGIGSTMSLKAVFLP